MKPVRCTNNDAGVTRQRRRLGSRIRILIGTTILALFAPCHAANVVRIPTKKKGAGPLFQIHLGAKWGFMDRSGKVVIPPEFDDEGDFFNHRAKVQKDSRWGYIDDTGRIVVTPRFDNAGDFREGLAPVQVGRGWGFIEPSGKLAIAAQFQAAAEFADGLARFEVWDTISCSSIDYRKKEPDVYTKDNAPLLAFRLHDTVAGSAGCFSENLRYGYIDKTGRIVISPKFIVASDFSEGLAAVREDGALYGYIDETGKMVIRPQFDQACSFSEGLAAVEIGFEARGGKKVAGLWGFINRTGGWEIQPTFELTHSFSEGLADVSLDGSSWGYIDGHGAFAIRPKYSITGAFSEGLALVWPEDEEGGYYIDKTGKKALVLGLWPQWSFSDGLTVAGREGERKYVDRQGRVVAPYEVDPQI